MIEESVLPTSAESVARDITQAGIRATPVRVAMLRYLRTVGRPLTHANVVEELSEVGADKATLFRNLNLLTEVGLLRRTELGDHVWRFEAISLADPQGQNHPHFVCIDCGTVACLDEVKLTANSLQASNRVGEVTEILLRGRCNHCRDV